MIQWFTPVSMITALAMVVKNGPTAIVKQLLDDVRVDPHNNYALVITPQNGHAEIVKLLLNNSRVGPTSTTMLLV